MQWRTGARATFCANGRTFGDGHASMLLRSFWYRGGKSPSATLHTRAGYSRQFIRLADAPLGMTCFVVFVGVGLEREALRSAGELPNLGKTRSGFKTWTPK